MSSEGKNYLLPFMMTAAGPWISNILLIVLLRNTKNLKLEMLTKMETSEASMNLLYFQCLLQSIQVIFFGLIQVTNWSNEQNSGHRKFTYVSVVITLIIVPIVGIVTSPSLYLLEYLGDDLDKENHLKAWLSVYPMVCIMSIVKYVVMHE